MVKVVPVGGDRATVHRLLHRVLILASHSEGLREGWDVHRRGRFQASSILLPDFDPILHTRPVLVNPGLHGGRLRHAVVV